MEPSAFVLQDMGSTTCLNSVVDVGNLDQAIDVVALFRCKTCGYSGIDLDGMTKHLSDTANCAKVVEISNEALLNPYALEKISMEDHVMLDDTGTSTTVAQDVNEVIEGIVASSDLIEPESLLESTKEKPPERVKRKRGRPRKSLIEQRDDFTDTNEASNSSTPATIELPDGCENFRCRFCPEEFSTYDQLLSHQGPHIAEKMESKRAHGGISRPARKIKREDDSKPMPCPICPMEFLTGFNVLQKHFTCHIGDEKRFKCPWCEMEYKTWRRMFVHLAEHDDKNYRKSSDIVTVNINPITQEIPSMRAVDEDEFSENDTESDNDSDVYVPLPESYSKSPTDDQTETPPQRKRGRPRKSARPNPPEIRPAVKQSDYQVLPFPGLDGVFVIGNANENNSAQSDNSNISSSVLVADDGTVKGENHVSDIVTVVTETESETKGEDPNSCAEVDQTPQTQTLEDLIDAIEKEVKRQQTEIETPVDENHETTIECDNNKAVDSEVKEHLKEGNVPVLKTYWIENTMKSALKDVKSSENEETQMDINSDENQGSSVDGDDGSKVLSFCPHCMLTRGAPGEIELHIKSHNIDENNFVCTLCSLETIKSFDTWDDLRSHYEKDHWDVATWPSASMWGNKELAGDGENINPVQKKRPMKKYGRVKPHKCSRCKTVYLHSLEEVDLHKKCHVEGDDSVFKCTVCDQEFTAWFRVINHMVEDHRDGIRFIWQKSVSTTCHICGITKKSFKHLQSHIRTVHKKKNAFKCSICGDEFQFQSSWKRHEESHQPAGTWKCETCGFVAKHSFALKTHIMIKHEKKGYNCPYCKYLAPQKKTLEKHIFMVHQFDGTMAMCDICGQQFKNPSSVVNHKRRKHSKNPTLRCEICGFETIDHIYMKAHIQKRHEPKKFKCSFCPYGTMTEQALSTHLKTHTEHRPYVCTFENCFFRARDQKTLSSHIRNSHVNDESLRKYQCHTCGKRFKTATILKHHLPVHTGEKPHGCYYCPFVSKHRSTVYRHMIREHKHGQADQLTTLAIVNEDKTQQSCIIPQGIINQITTNEDGALIVDETAVQMVTQQTIDGIHPNVDETTTILVIDPLDNDRIDQVQSEVIVDSQNSNNVQHEAAVKILQQLMQMADTGQSTSIDLIEVSPNDITIETTEENIVEQT